MRPMLVLIGCESSGAVRDEFARLGHFAMSCDLLPSERPGWHYQGDIRDLLWMPWDLLICHPPCTYLSSSGLHWIKRGRIESDGRPRSEHFAEGLTFARMLIEGPEVQHIPKRVAENPIGALSTHIRKPDQIIQPHQFGDDASKATCLWLHGVDPLVAVAPHLRASPRQVWNDKRGRYDYRWANQTDSGQNVLPPSADRWKLRSQTYPGVARAMAHCWGGIVDGSVNTAIHSAA